MRVRVRDAVLGAVLAVATGLGSAAVPGAAHANPWSEVDCDQFPDHAGCRAEGGAPGAPAWVAGPAGDVVCRDDAGQVVDCFLEGRGWIGADGCRYLFNGSDSPPAGAGPGGWYVRQCSEAPGGGVVWLAGAQAPGRGLLGRVAASRLVLPPPPLELNPPPPAPQLVMLPTWLWVAPQWWRARSASAAVPGITVTAVATPVRVRWLTGDGGEHVCDAGTPYEPGIDPAAASPDCGHTYTRASTGEPGGAYALTATVTWQVSWSGGGASGTLDPLFSTATVPVPVVESRSVNTGGQP